LIKWRDETKGIKGMLTDRVTSKQRINAPLARKLHPLKTRLCFILRGTASMAKGKNQLTSSIFDDDYYHYHENFDEDGKSSQLFASEQDEHCYFDNLQRARDIGSA
jgi:hypothetical protein